MSHTYSFETPELSLGQGIVQFFQNFYRISDTPGTHDNYIDQFAEDATFILAGKESTGKDDIRTLRLSMWEHVKERKHTIYKIFPFGNDATEFMIYGNVRYVLKTGETKDVEWSARAQLVLSPAGKWRFQYYRVWLG